MRQFDLHPVAFKNGKVLESEAIGALLLDDEGFELEWDEPDEVEALEEKLEQLLESPIYGIGPHPDPAIQATVRIELEVGTPAWLARVSDLLEGPNFRLRMREIR